MQIGWIIKGIFHTNLKPFSGLLQEVVWTSIGRLLLNLNPFSIHVRRLMTEVGPDRRIALVEYIAHLSVQDWQGVAKDLVALGFAPEGT